MSSLPAVPQYQDLLKATARVFLERHHGEHLADDQQLLSRAVQHLVTDYDALPLLAEKSVYLASSDMHAIRGHAGLRLIRP